MCSENRAHQDAHVLSLALSSTPCIPVPATLAALSNKPHHKAEHQNPEPQIPKEPGLKSQGPALRPRPEAPERALEALKAEAWNHTAMVGGTVCNIESLDPIEAPKIGFFLQVFFGIVSKRVVGFGRAHEGR